MLCIKCSRLLWVYDQKKHETVTDKSPMRKYVNKIENRTTYIIKMGYYLELLTSETMRLLGSNKSKITKMKMVKTYLMKKLLK